MSEPKKKPAYTQAKKAIPKKEDNKILQLGLILALFGFLLYSNTINHGYVLDDFSAIKENNIVRQGVKAIPEIFKTSYRQGYLSVKDGLYRPLSLAMYAVEWEYFPDQPWISHLVNVLLYALTGFMLFYFLFELTKGNKLFSFLATLLFLAHPLHVEVVANIKSRDEILCFLFTIGSFWYLLKYIDSLSADKKKNSQPNRKWLMLSLLLFFLSFLSKETSIVCLAIIPLLLHLFRGIKLRQTIFMLLPFVGVALIYLMIRYTVLQGAMADSNVSISDNILAGAGTFNTHAGTAFYILGLYFIKLFFPDPLSYDYSFNQIPVVGMENILSILALIVYASIALYALIYVFKSFSTNSPSDENNLLVFGIMFFLVTIFLFSNLVLIIGTSMGDRLMYFPSFGFCIAFVYLFIKYVVRSNTTLSFTNSKLYLFFVVLVAFSIKTYSRNSDWKDNHTLYSHDVNIAPNSVKAHYYLGLELVKTTADAEPDADKKRKIIEQGISELEKAVTILPSFAGAYTQLGVAHYRLKNFEKAIENYNKAAALSPSDAITLNNIGTIYFEWKRYPEAKEKFIQAIAIDSRFVDAHMNLGSVCGQTGDFKNAIISFQNALRFAPDNAQAYYFMALSYANSGDKINADKYFSIAGKMNPSLKR